MIIRKTRLALYGITLGAILNENAGAIMTPALYISRQLRRLQISGCGLAAAPVGFDVEAELLAFVKRAHAGALDG
jgi:hypothetical protein